MSVKIRVEWNPDTRKKFSELSEKGQQILDQEVLKSSNVFIPMDTGELMRSSLRATQFGSGKIIWDTSYARKLYFNPEYKFSTDKNSQAQGLWFEVAKSRDLNSWIDILEKLKDSTF